TDRIAEKLKKKVNEIPGTVDINISREQGAPELWVDVERDKASSMGLNVSDVANTVRTSIYGQEASKYRVAGDEYDIFVRLREQDRSRPEDLSQLPLRLPNEKLIRTDNVADVSFKRGPIEIERKDQVRIVRVEGDVHGRSLGEVIAETEDIVADMDIPTGITIEMGGQDEDMRESFFWLTLALGLGAILVYMVMASQFESLLHPFVVLFSVPFAFVGVAWALFLLEHSLNIVVFLGMLLLIGVVVNNAIVLVDYTNILRARGLEMTEAIQEAGERRLRPVLMTAFTTILALVPMAFGGGQGSEVWNPLGSTILGGLLVATLVTLVIVPVMYSILERGNVPKT
ncbi:MAG: efflux RND transporter permease subunit, partial [Planctomycetota bacterium]